MRGGVAIRSSPDARAIAPARLSMHHNGGDTSVRIPPDPARPPILSSALSPSWEFHRLLIPL